MSAESVFVVRTVFDVLNKMNRAVDRNFKAADYYGEGLNKSHIKTLLTLKVLKSGSMTEIGQQVGLVKGAFSPLVERLVQLGYIQKTLSPNDRRKSILSLTPRGETYASKIGLESAAAFEVNFECLSIDEQQDFLQHLNGLSKLLDILNNK
jgi:DNA-binding MarR family transcriptional regulator